MAKTTGTSPEISTAHSIAPVLDGGGHDAAATAQHTKRARAARQDWAHVDVWAEADGGHSQAVDHKAKRGPASVLPAADADTALSIARSVAAAAYPGVEIHILRSKP